SRRVGLARLAGTLIKGGLGCSAIKRATNVTHLCRTISPSIILEADNSDTKRTTIRETVDECILGNVGRNRIPDWRSTAS
ncbi:hypothetical protein EV122DRAFT_223414, partial [Schizophyllum commune]